ncbi:MAG: hypothetical protein K0S27_1044 [Gammaproteobacteria bacterium]|jgi:hypothetical protein|nr:hypothetical protein [Gammaproteobacteria bacterium]
MPSAGMALGKVFIYSINNIKINGLMGKNVEERSVAV